MVTNGYFLSVFDRSYGQTLKMRRTDMVLTIYSSSLLARAFRLAPLPLRCRPSGDLRQGCRWITASKIRAHRHHPYHVDSRVQGKNHQMVASKPYRSNLGVWVTFTTKRSRLNLRNWMTFGCGWPMELPPFDNNV